MNNLESQEIFSFENLTHDINTKVTLWILLVATAVLFCLQFMLQKRRKKCDHNLITFEDLRGPIGLPVIGAIWVVIPIEKLLYNMMELSKKFGACFRLRFLNEKIVILNSPELVQSFLKSGDTGHLVKAPLIFDLMKSFIPNGVVVSKGSVWKSNRKVLSRFMFISNIKQYFPTLQKHTSRFVKTLETLSNDGQPNSISELVNIFSLEIITELLTGADVHGTQGGFEYYHNFETWKKSIMYRILNPWLLSNFLWKFHPMQQKQCKAIKDMTEFSQQRLAECKTRREEKNVPTFQTMIDAMIDADASDAQIIDELSTMTFGGHDTMAATIQYFFLLMALNPHHQKLCKNEVDHVFDVANGQLNFESLSDLNYLERCILETLRMFPVAFGFVRMLESPLNIDYNNKTLSLEPGTNVFIWPWLLHRNPEYFPNPDIFNPDRFLPHESAKRHTHAFLPFSAGLRNCLGIKYAMMQLKLVAAYVLHNFEVKTIEKIEDIVLLPMLILSPQKEFRFVFKGRN